ncbi:MAG: PIN domain-containing protein [Bacillota bacterium]|jgi:predicted nucleic acid-binding protein
MYKVLLDTNILLDYLLIQRPGNAAAQRLMEMAVENKLTGYVFPISLLNIFFILRKQMNEQERKEIIENFLEILEITDLDFDVMQSGLYIPIEDYEDGVQYMCAVKMNVDFIITQDQQFQQYNLELKRIGPEEFLANYS